MMKKITIYLLLCLMIFGSVVYKANGQAKRLMIEMMPGDTISMHGFNMRIMAKDDSGGIVNSYNDSVFVQIVTGPGIFKSSVGNVFDMGMAEFNNLSLDKPGYYRFIAKSGKLVSDTTKMIFADTIKIPGPGPVPPTKGECNEATAGERTNLGLYGGSSYDLTYSPYNNRLFATIETPASLFYSDDTAKTWIQAFPDDSLEYECGERGWGGGGTKVLANNVGWVAVQTSQQGGTLTSCVVSFSGGDTSTWITALDPVMLEMSGYSGKAGSIGAIGLSDYYVYMGSGPTLARMNDTTSYWGNKAVLDLTTYLGTGYSIRSIAVANDSSGYPVYMLVNHNGSNDVLMKYDGVVLDTVVTPASEEVLGVFTHPVQITGDTMFINTKNISGQYHIYRSFDGGVNWTDISLSGSNWEIIFDADYSASWVADMPLSNGLRLGIPGIAVSDDLGDTWKKFQLQNNGGATHPQDTALVVGTEGRGVMYSISGAQGNYTLADNYGLESVKILQIAKSSGSNVFYLATKAGMAYTTAYNDTSVAPFDKWNPPYGEFPMTGIGSATAVAIDQNDSLHVIAGLAGHPGGFYVSTTGPTGFSVVTPTSWNTAEDQATQDIVFVTSNIVIAVTGTGDQANDGGLHYGHIFRSDDGGQTWDTVSAPGFEQGNCIGVGNNSIDTVIYIGCGASGGTSTAKGVLWKSTDLGLTWSYVNFGPMSTTSALDSMPIWDLAVDPRGIDTIYLASGDNLDNAFVRSTDGGVTYDYVDVFGEGAFTAIAINQDQPDTVYTAIRREIYLYSAISDSAFMIFRGLPGEMVPDLVYGSVLAGTNTGFFRIGEDVIEEITVDINEIVINNDNTILIYPNPFEAYTNIRFNLDEQQEVTVRLFDMMGKQRAVLIEGKTLKGEHQLRLDAGDLPVGTYFIRIQIGDRIENRKVLLVR